MAEGAKTGVCATDAPGARLPIRVGAAERELIRAIERYTVWLRAAIIMPCSLFGLLAAPAGNRPATGLLVTVALGWCLLRLSLLGDREARWPTLVAADVSALAVLGLGQVAAGAQDASGWIFAAVSITCVTYPYEWPTRPMVGVGLPLFGLAAYVLGFTLAESGAWSAALPATARGLVELTLSRLSYLLVRSHVRTVDRVAERVAERRRQAAVAAARRAGEREYMATLHDTASTTLLMVAAGTGTDARWLPERARQDLDELARVPGSEAGSVDLGSLLATAARHHAVEVRQDIGDLPPLPAGPALAVFHGVREALTNVERHAGVAAAELRAGLGDDGRITVELRDDGRGFHPGRVPPHRRGISRSIVERMASVGGRATVASAPGRGTTLRWTWPA